MCYYGLEIVRGRVIICACQVDIYMYCKSVHAGCSYLPSIKVVVPAPHIPSSVSPAAQVEVLLLTTCSLLGCFHDMLSHG